MKNTRKNVVELLKKMSKLAMKMYGYYKADKKYATAKRYLSESIAYDTAIWLLTKEEFFNSQAEIFKDDTEGTK